MKKSLVLLSTFIFFVSLTKADITYYFADNPSLQGNNGVSFSGSTITTDGTKGFLSVTNIKSINFKVNYGDGLTNIFLFTKNGSTSLFPNPTYGYRISNNISINNLFATDSHVGFINPLATATSSGSKPVYMTDFQQKYTNQNFSLTLPSIDSLQQNKIKYGYELANFGKYPEVQNFVNNYTYTGNAYIDSIATGSFPWYVINYASNEFYNFGARHVEGGWGIGSDFLFGPPSFSISSIDDTIHMQNEIISDGYTAFVWNQDHNINVGPLVIASSVPEPSALSLLAIGLGGWAMMRRRRS